MIFLEVFLCFVRRSLKLSKDVSIWYIKMMIINDFISTQYSTSILFKQWVQRKSESTKSKYITRLKPTTLPITTRSPPLPHLISYIIQLKQTLIFLNGIINRLFLSKFDFFLARYLRRPIIKRIKIVTMMFSM